MKNTQWHGNTREAKALQQDLRSRIDLRNLVSSPTLIGGADISCNRFSKTVFAGIVVMDYQTMAIIERKGVAEEIHFPYIPGYLSFREVPSLLKAWSLLKQKPDVVMLDGHGILHPRMMGVASHFGLEAGVATLGCGKSRLIGEHDTPGADPGAVQPVSVADELRGFILRTRKNANPIYLSPGTGMSCHDALAIARHCLRGYRLPEPTRQAHLFVNALRVAQSASDEGAHC